MQSTEQKQHLVTVTLGITTESGERVTVEKSIERGETPVTILKQELGVPDDESLWFVKHGKKKLLGDHEKHNVKEHDHFETIVKGGVS